MIPLLTHIDYTIEAPFLDVFEESKYDFEKISTAGLYHLITANVDVLSDTVPDTQNALVSSTSKRVKVKKGDVINVYQTTAGSARNVYFIGTGHTTYTTWYAGTGSTTQFVIPEDGYIAIAMPSNQPATFVQEYTLLSPVVYKAHLEDKDTETRTDIVVSTIEKIDESKPYSNGNCFAAFKFEACRENGKGLDQFEDRAKLSLYIYNEEQTEAWYKEKCYRVKKTLINHRNGTD